MSTWKVVRVAIVGALFLPAVATVAAAQKGGRGGSGTGGSTPSSDSRPSESMATSVSRRVRNDLDGRDPMEFMLKHDKQLTLTAPQKDSIKSFAKQMDNDQKPIYKELQKVLGDAEREQALSVTGGGGRGSGGGGGVPALARDLITHLGEVQDGYGTKAKAQLNEGQLHMNDSLYTIHTAELKEKAEKARGGRPGI